MSASQRVKRWRVGSGGKVFVLNTGDGKIVFAHLIEPSRAREVSLDGLRQ
jgi:hypothetical protein